MYLDVKVFNAKGSHNYAASSTIISRIPTISHKKEIKKHIHSLSLLVLVIIEIYFTKRLISTVSPRFSPLTSIKPHSNKPPWENSVFTTSPLPSNKPPWGLIEFYEKVEMKPYLNKPEEG